MNTTIGHTPGNAFQHMLHPSAMRDYFAAHAPEVPDDFEWKERETFLSQHLAVGVTHLRDETVAQRIIRWRLFYADQMIAALEAK